MSIKRPKIFLDSGDPAETKKAKGLLGFLDGQTTNPSLVAKNPSVQKFLASGKKLTEKELLAEYKNIIKALDQELAGAISVEVYADWDTKAAEMLKQANEMAAWGRNIYVKFPTIPEGLKAAHDFAQKGGRVNMTLVFDEHQAAAVYTATMTSPTIPHFVSPFIGRWDDRGFDGLDLVRNIIKMYKKFDKQRHAKKAHVEVLAASIRSMDHFYASIFMGADILTVPMTIITQWIDQEHWIPDKNYRVPPNRLKALIYQDLPLKQTYTDYTVEKKDNDLLDEGLRKFAKDWNNLLAH